MLSIPVVLALLIVSGCQVGEPRCQHWEWMARPTSLYAQNFERVCLDTKQAVGTVRVENSESLWQTYVHGAAYGEFLDKEGAMARVERIITRERW